MMAMKTRTSRSEFENDDGTLRPMPCLSAVTGLSRPNFFRRHPIISIIGAGILAYAGISYRSSKVDVEITYNRTAHPSIEDIPMEEPYFPFEELAAEPVSNIESVVGFFNEELTYGEYSEAQKELLKSELNITNEESYIDYAEGRIPDETSVNN